MKFENIIHEIVKNHQMIFRKDPCIHKPSRGVNVRAHVLSRQNARAHVYASCARMCAQIFTKNLLMILYYLVNRSLEFHKDRSFCLEIFAKQYWHLFNLYFLCYFAYFQNLSIKVMLNFEKYGKCLGIFANTNSKCTCIREILPYVRGMKVVLGPCIHCKLYISSRGTPCRFSA